MGLTLTPNAEAIPGYRLTAPLGKGGVGEVWKCQAPGGLFKALKLVRKRPRPDESAGAEQEWEALHRVKDIRHPFLLAMDRVEVIHGELLIVMELADKSLRTLLQECERGGRPGVPREELLGYLREAAEVLDLLRSQYGLQHLDVKPDNLFLVANHLKVGDFGLVTSFQQGTSGSAPHPQVAAFSPLYTAPERFRGSVSPGCDQYSLAVTYHELLTGRPVFDGKSARALLCQHLSAEPDLTLLPAGDRPAVARALAKDPAERFDSCSDFVGALLGRQGPDGHGQGQPESRHLPARDSQSGPTPTATTPAAGDEGRRDPRCGLPPPRDPSDSGRPTEPASVSPTGALPGFEFLQYFGGGPLGDLWKVKGPDGKVHVARMLSGCAPDDLPQRENALRRLRSLRHPTLAPVQVVSTVAGQLVVLTPPPDGTLRHRFEECRSNGLPGIPRPELLSHLRAAAEALDDLYEEHRLHHLALHPGNLVLLDGRIRLCDFGLVHLLWLPAGASMAQLNPRYAAPERGDGAVERSADLFSLALIYQEMLTGIHPWRGPSAPRAAQSRRVPKLDLDHLNGLDRAVIAKALALDPHDRYGTCTEWVDALEALPALPAEGRDVADGPAVEAPGPPPDVASPRTDHGPGPVLPAEVVADLCASVAGRMDVRERGNVRYWTDPSGSARHTCLAHLLPGITRVKLEGFRLEWKAQDLGFEKDRGWAFRIPLQGTFWQRCLGRPPSLEVRVQFNRLRPDDPTAKVSVTIAATKGLPRAYARKVDEMVPHVLASLRAYLQPYPENRAALRLPYDEPAQVWPARKGQVLGTCVAGRARDLSTGGMRLWVPEHPRADQVQVALAPARNADPIRVAAEVRWLVPAENGGYEVGVHFQERVSVAPDGQPSTAEDCSGEKTRVRVWATR
jgi:serine/threonine protein kinase